MSKVSSVKSVFRKILECTKSVNVSVNNVSLQPNTLFNNRVCVVTGASRGIGKAVVKELLNSGATVIGIARNKDTLEKLKTEINSASLFCYVCDIGNIDMLDVYIKDMLEMANVNHIDVLINCAGIKNGNDERYFEYTPNDFDEVINVNIRAPFFWCQKIGEHMINNNIKGHIVNVASIKGFIGEASPYGISKWGMVCLTQGLGRLLAGKGIVVNGVAPGGTATDMAPYKEGDSLTHLVTPNLRLALPSEIAKIAVFLASDMGSNIVGQVIVADGGQVL